MENNLNQGIHSDINWHLTEKYSDNEKFKRYVTWAKHNGAIFDKVRLQAFINIDNLPLYIWLG